VGLITFLILGLIAGSLANAVMDRSGKGLGSSLILGVIGAMVGGPLLGLLGLRAGGFVGSLVTATIGAVALIWIVRKIRGGSGSKG
jgi:uncharacterized membrane protein YeaQ/YmgE (transglycosylase-associated protein family)